MIQTNNLPIYGLDRSSVYRSNKGWTFNKFHNEKYRVIPVYHLDILRDNG